MGQRFSRFAGGLLATTFLLCLPALADDSAAEPAGASKFTAKAPGKLVPFPEDEQQPKRVADAPRVEQPSPKPKSNFRPKFKQPAVRQAQHVEPIEPQGDSGPQLQPAPPADVSPAPLSTADSAHPGIPKAAAAPNSASAGQAAINEAFAKAKQCSAEADYTTVIDLCRKASEAGLKKNFEQYASRLMGWAYNHRGELRAEAGQEKEALADFEAAVETGGTWRAVHNRGVSYAAQGRFKEALTDFDRAIELNAQYPNAFFNRGELKYEQGDFAGAVHDYTAALKLAPEAATYNSRGHAFYRLQKFGDALRDYGEAIKLDPANAAALINRGDTFSDMGQYADAAKDYRAAVRIAPKLGRAYQSAAWLMATCPDQHYRNDQLAIDAAKRAVELDGEDYRNLSTLAAAQANAGQFVEARAMQEKAIAKAPKPDRVTAEKMMSLYGREVAFRDRPRNVVEEPAEQGEVRQASATEPIRKPAQPSGNQRRPAPRGRYQQPNRGWW